MFRKKKKLSKNPEVLEAEANRDALMVDVHKAIRKVDILKDELLSQYEEADTKSEGATYNGSD